MHILHLAGAYGGSEVYKSLYSAIDRLGIRQTVFVPLNAANHHHIGNNPVDFKTQGSKIIYSTISLSAFDLQSLVLPSIWNTFGGI